MSKGFSAIFLVSLIAVGLVALGIYLHHNYNYSFNISKKDLPFDSQETIPTVNLQKMTCGYLGFDEGELKDYTIFSHPNLYKYGANYSEKLNSETTEKINQSLRQVMQKIPPEHNPKITVCFTDRDKFILIDDKYVNLLYLDNQYNLIKTIELKDFTPIYDFVAYTNDKVLYLQQSSKDYDIGKMTDAVLKININDGSQKLINYSERVESVGVPQKDKKTQSATITSKNLGITFTAPAGTEPTYSPLFDHTIEYFYFRRGADELEVMLGKDNQYCREAIGGYYSETKQVKVADKWMIKKVRTDDPRDKQVVWRGEVLADDNVCIYFKETLNEDMGLEATFDDILTNAKVN